MERFSWLCRTKSISQKIPDKWNFRYKWGKIISTSCQVPLYCISIIWTYQEKTLNLLLCENEKTCLVLHYQKVQIKSSLNLFFCEKHALSCNSLLASSFTTISIINQSINRSNYIKRKRNVEYNQANYLLNNFPVFKILVKTLVQRFYLMIFNSLVKLL